MGARDGVEDRRAEEQGPRRGRRESVRRDDREVRARDDRRLIAGRIGEGDPTRSGVGWVGAGGR